MSHDQSETFVSISTPKQHELDSLSQCFTGLFLIVANQRISLENLKFGNYLRHCVQDFTIIPLRAKIALLLLSQLVLKHLVKFF